MIARTCLVVASALTVLPAHAGDPATFTPLDVLPGYDTSAANAVSGDGLTVVGVSDVTTPNGIVTTAFRWTAEDGMIPLPSLVDGDSTFAYAVSYDGSHAAGASQVPMELAIAVRWKTDVGVEGLEDLDPKTVGFSEAWAISALGDQVAGIGDGCTCGMFGQGFTWSRRRGMMGLGWIGADDMYSRAAGMSADGGVIVGEVGPLGSRTAFRWTPTTGMQSIDEISTPLTGFGDSTRATAVSADGTTIVGAGFFDLGTVEAWRWTKPQGDEGGMVGLGDLPGGILASEALAVSADGFVIVGFGDADNGGTAAVWYGDGPPMAIMDLLADAGVDLTGWELDSARGISWDGRTIVGAGRFEGVPQAWMAYLPLPGE